MWVLRDASESHRAGGVILNETGADVQMAREKANGYPVSGLRRIPPAATNP